MGYNAKIKDATAKDVKLRDWDNGLSFIVPTFRRVDDLRLAIKSLDNQLLDITPAEIIIVDNDPAASAKDFVNEFQKTSKIETIYIHCPEPGVSNARNAAMEIQRGRYIIFLDDDMDVAPDWAQKMINTSKNLNATIVFSPVYARIPGPIQPMTPYLRSFFSRLVDKQDEGLISETLGTGGSLIDTMPFDILDPPFDPSCNETGGEDDLFFDHLRQQGALVGWSPEAKAYECVPLDRTKTSYVAQRSFGFGQGTTRIQAKRGVKGVPGVIRYTLTGAAQFFVYGTMALILRLFNRPAALKFLSLAIMGSGKVFWGTRFAPKFYGASQIKD